MNGPAWAVMVALALVGCSDDDTTPKDMGPPDAADIGPVDGNVPDDMRPDMISVDLGPRDGNVDMPMLSPTSIQIQAVRDAELGDISLPVDEATVTYVIEAVGSDPAGFFVQDQIFGPALFVAVDPATLTPTPEPGDVVSFRADRTMRFLSQHRVVAISGFTRDDTGEDLSALTQDLSGIGDVASNLPFYESELVTFEGTLGNDAAFSGIGFDQWKLQTEAIDDSLLVARAPEALDRQETFGVGCSVRIGPTPLWRHRGEAMAMAWSAADITVTECPALTLRDAKGSDENQLLLRFSRPVDPGSFSTGDLTFTPALTANVITVEDTIVVVDTSLQMRGQDYDVSVSNVTDTDGGPLDPSERTRPFAGVGDTVTPGENDLTIAELMINPGARRGIGLEWIEVVNPQPLIGGETFQLRGCTIRVRDGQSDPQPLRWTYFIRPQEFTVIGGRPVGEPPGIVRLRPLLEDEGDEITLDCGGVVDSVDFSQADFPRPVGASAQLAASVLSATANDDPAAWCGSPPDRNYGTMDLKGTPAMVNQPCGGGTLLLTQYIEGNAGVQAIEIANVGSAPQTLNFCELRVYLDGSSAPSAVIDLPGERTLLPDGTFTVCNTGVSTACDIVNASLNFDGDDTLTLFCNSGVVDRFGQIGVRAMYTTPGGLSSQNQTLNRSCAVIVGDMSAMSPFTLTQWEGDGAGSTDDETGLGVYDCP